MAINKIEALRARVAKLAPEQRERLRTQVEAAGIAWEKVAPQDMSVAQDQPARLPLSPAQMQFWLMHQVAPDSTASAIAFSWRIDGPLDRDALSKALAYLVDRHMPLRSCFPAEEGTPWHADVRGRFQMEQSRTSLSEYDALERAFVSAPYDLARGPLFRAHLVTLGPSTHRLMLSLHHIIADGWSRGVFMRELATAYRATRRGTAPDLPKLTKEFPDFVLAQQHWLQSPAATVQATFWQEQLAGLATQTLPTKPCGTAQDFTSETQVFELGAELSQLVKDTAAQLGATPFMVLLAVFKLLLHRYSGQNDIAVGTPTAGRRDEAAAGVVGLFVNTLVLRSQIRDDMRFVDWLAHVRQGFAQSFDNQDLPLATVVDAVGAERRAGHTPLFQTLFQVQTDSYRQQNATQIDLGDPALEVEQVLIPLRETKFDLSWHMMERDHGLSVIVEYRNALFDADFMRQMVGHFQTLLRHALTRPQAPLAELGIIAQQEQDRLIDTGPDMRVPAPVPEHIRRHAATTPEAVALIFQGQKLSYAEVERRTESLAHKLRHHPGLRPDSRVVVALDRGLDLVIALLAIMRAGLTYVPLDPAQPETRKAHILADCQADLLLCDRPMGQGSFLQLSMCDLQDLPDGIDNPAMPPVGVQPDGLAYVIYTSGSTGRPKGVPITHQSLSNLLGAMTQMPGGDTPGICDDTRWLAITTIGFDIAGLELFGPLVAGGTLVLADRDTVLSPPALSALIETQEISHMQATPALWRALVESGWHCDRGLTCLCGGEALDTQLAQDLLARLGETGALWNMYGPTETTIWSSALRVRGSHLNGSTVPLGPPVANTSLHVIDRYGDALPAGIPGELAIGGAGLSPGYWNREDLTAQAFVKGRYRTGDLVRRRADGCLEFLGRIDTQIKLNGFRIEPGEIEALLLEAGLLEALVVLDPDAARLVAYCRSGNEELEVDQLKLQLADRLPGYMVPSAFVFLETFELNANGKIDRAKLPAPEQMAATPDRGPKNETEEILHEIWCAVLNRETIGMGDNFFDLGGASISAMQIVARARDKGLVLEPAQLFENQTIASQALVVGAGHGRRRAPLSPWQTFLQGYTLEPWLLTLPLAASLHGDAPARLLAAARIVAQQHEMLRITLGTGWELGAFDPARITSGADLPGDLGAWARSNITAGQTWAACITPDNRLALALCPLLYDMTSAENLALQVRDALDSQPGGGLGRARSGASFVDWLAQDRRYQPSPISILPAAPARQPEEGGTVRQAVTDSSLASLRMSAEVLDTTGERLALLAWAQTLVQWVNLPSIGFDFVTSSHSATGQVHRFGNQTRLLPMNFARLQGSTAQKIGVLGQLLDSAGPLGIEPRADHVAGALFSWRAALSRDIDWLSRPDRPLPRGYALLLEAEASPKRWQFQWHFDAAHIARDSVVILAKRFEALLLSLRAQPASARGTPAKTGNRLDQLKSQIRRPKPQGQ